MKRSMKAIPVLLSAFAAICDPAFAQQPPDAVTSDVYGNTAMGIDALLNDSPSTPSHGNWNGDYNTAAGSRALSQNTTGYFNTATGFEALDFNTTGNHNTAMGANALNSNTTGIHNTAVGHGALIGSNGNYNTAVGSDALWSNFSGSLNTATGYQALVSNTTGSNNAAFGSNTLFSNTTGTQNTAFGPSALYYSTTGNNNTAFGFASLVADTTGSNNTATGWEALYYNYAGSNNTAVGYAALFVGSGNNNIAVGYQAGYNLTQSNNIDIGNLGVAGDSGTIRIGTSAVHTTAYVAGVFPAKVTGCAVYVTSSGQLGCMGSSERFKTDIATMVSPARKLDQLRPVTFKYKTEPNGPVQYGLIAEEVDKVLPDLVIRNNEGRIDGVRYEELAPMLLKDVQEMGARLAGQEQEITGLRSLKEAVARQEDLISSQETELHAMRQQLAEVAELKQQLVVLKQLTQTAPAIQVKLPMREGCAEKM